MFTATTLLHSPLFEYRTLQFHISLFGDGFYLVNGADTEKPENLLAVREPELLPHSPQLSRVLRRRRRQLTRVSPPPLTAVVVRWII